METGGQGFLGSARWKRVPVTSSRTGLIAEDYFATPGTVSYRCILKPRTKNSPSFLGGEAGSELEGRCLADGSLSERSSRAGRTKQNFMVSSEVRNPAPFFLFSSPEFPVPQLLT